MIFEICEHENTMAGKYLLQGYFLNVLKHTTDWPQATNTTMGSANGGEGFFYMTESYLKTLCSAVSFDLNGHMRQTYRRTDRFL